MPVIRHAINELYNSVTRPVASAVVRHVMRLTGIPQDTSLMYIGDSGAAPLEGATVEGSDAPARFTQYNKVFVEVTEESLPEDVLTRFTTQREQLPIFKDDNLKVEFYPIYAKTRQTISLKLRAEDRGTAQRWRNGIAARLSQGRLHHPHELDYHYIVPNNCVELLVDIFNKREAVEGYGDTLQEWIRAHMTPKATTLTTAVGTQAKLAIKEKQIRVIGRFDFESPPMEERDGNGSVYTASVDYIVEYDQPIAVVTRYPITIHSQFLERRWWADYEQYTLDYSSAYSSYSLNALSRVVAAQSGRTHNPAIEGVMYPPADDWYPERKYLGCMWLGRFLTLPDASGAILANLTELGGPKLSEATIAYLKRHPQYATNQRQSPVFIKVYEDSDELVPGEYTVTPTLDITTSITTSKRKRYHFTIGVLTDLTLLTPEAVTRLLNDPEFVKDLTGVVPVTLPNGKVDPSWWDKYTRPGQLNNLERRTVTAYGIITHRHEELKQ